MKIGDAKYCINCNNLFAGHGAGSCPKCGSEATIFMSVWLNDRPWLPPHIRRQIREIMDREEKATLL